MEVLILSSSILTWQGLRVCLGLLCGHMPMLVTFSRVWFCWLGSVLVLTGLFHQQLVCWLPRWRVCLLLHSLGSYCGLWPTWSRLECLSGVVGRLPPLSRVCWGCWSIPSLPQRWVSGWALWSRRLSLLLLLGPLLLGPIGLLLVLLPVHPLGLTGGGQGLVLLC